MPWNWELPEWPKFIYNLERITQKERQFLLNLLNKCTDSSNISYLLDFSCKNLLVFCVYEIKKIENINMILYDL